jgi:hypothetical protein
MYRLKKCNNIVRHNIFTKLILLIIVVVPTIKNEKYNVLRIAYVALIKEYNWKNNNWFNEYNITFISKKKSK